MGNLLAYSGTTTKIRAIRSRLLTSENYRELAAIPTVTDALAYLKRQPGYQELFANVDESALHRSDIEKMLTNAIYKDFQNIYRFSPVGQRKFLELYFHRYEVAILKTCLRMVFDHRDAALDLKIFEDFFQRHSSISLRKISESRTIGEFVENLKGSIYYDALSRLAGIKDPTLWDYEMAIDLFYFDWFFKTGEKVMKKEQLRHFQDAYGTKMDLLNIMWIYRSRHYFHMTDAEIYAHLIPVPYHLRRSDIKSMVDADSREAFSAAVKNTYYGRRFEGFSAEHLQETYSQIRQQVQHKAAARDPYSVATVISYLYEKEHEIDKITTVLECVRYGLSQEETLKYIKGV